MSKRSERTLEMFEHVRMYQKSGLSQAGFCRIQDLNQGTFSYWLRKYENSQIEEQPVSAFVQLQAQSRKVDIELHLRNGLRVSLCSSGHSLVELVEELSSADV